MDWSIDLRFPLLSAALFTHSSLSPGSSNSDLLFFRPRVCKEVLLPTQDPALSWDLVLSLLVPIPYT